MSCAPSWTQPEDVPYNVFLFTFGFFLPLLLIIFTSWIAVSNIRRSCRNIESDDIKSSALARQYRVVKMVTIYRVSQKKRSFVFRPITQVCKQLLGQVVAVFKSSGYQFSFEKSKNMKRISEKIASEVGYSITKNC